MSWGAATTSEHVEDAFDDQDTTTTNEETTVTETKKPATRRRAKSAAELLADARKRVEELEARVAAQRDQNRLDFIERLYDHFLVEPIKGDLDESERLEKLRERLNVVFDDD